MTRAEYESMNLDELIEWGYENLNDVTTKDSLIDFAKAKLDDENLFMALHILNAIYTSVESYNGYYLYDYDMGTLETPTPITCKENFEDLIDFDEEDS